MVKKEGVSQWQRDALFDRCADLHFVHQSDLSFFTQMGTDPKGLLLSR